MEFRWAVENNFSLSFFHYSRSSIRITRVLISQKRVKVVKRISHERVIKGVVNLGLSLSDAEVYIHLVQQGPKTAQTIASALKMDEQLVYRSIRSLRSREIVKATLERPAEFSAIPFDKALELLMKAHLKKSQNIEREKGEILSQWRSMIAEHS